MKRFILLIFILCIALCVEAQSRRYTNAINDLRGQYKMSSMTLTQETLQVMTFFTNKLKDDAKELIEGIDILKVNRNSKASPDAFFNQAVKTFQDAKFYQIDISKYANPNRIAVFADRKLFSLKEAHIITKDERGLIISAFGKFKYRDIKKVIKRVEQNGHNIFD